ncbi:hypothetical protein [Sphingomonas sp. C3-2]|uniref:hypothetical protein n=1 Tax=Sphingomonas sp. C3-2 TaxID=3062169 RepID=UPI00294B43E3|nr:hypothetical protein [Sphingomonas sp. C3-2]WOK37749.1 hypothetical protein QYC26_06040 [Sphingomonas sp. C3-2]
MKTPYDSALRIRQSEIDDVRVAISVQVNQLTQIENSKAVVETRIQRETEIAAGDALMSSFAFVQRMRAERARLNSDKVKADTRLGQLRTEAVAAYGALRAIETAADSFRAEAESELARAEQTRSDDFAATAFVRRQAGMRRNAQ